MKFKSVVWSSTIDYPNEVSTVLFVGTCNWDCEYCYNKTLNKNKDIDFQTQILPRLIDRKAFVNHVVISGGECTLYPELEETINILIENGFIVGIHTNGSKPEIIKKILPKIKFIGMDIKSDFNTCCSFFSLKETQNAHLSMLIIIGSNIEYEFRTTLYPIYCNPINCETLAIELAMIGVKEWILQEYTNDFNNKLVKPYNKDYIKLIIDDCNKIIPTRLKGE